MSKAVESFFTSGEFGHREQNKPQPLSKEDLLLVDVINEITGYGDYRHQLHNNGTVADREVCATWRATFLKHGLKIAPAPKVWRATHLHHSGELYHYLGRGDYKNPTTGVWEPIDHYCSHSGKMYATSPERWATAFTPLNYDGE
jgi:hypothetical protein